VLPYRHRLLANHAFDTLSLDAWRWLIAAYWRYVTLIDEQIGRAAHRRTGAR
jgi:hypothetical protein